MKKNYKIFGAKISESDQKRGRSLEMKSEPKKARITLQSKYHDSSSSSSSDEENQTDNQQNIKEDLRDKKPQKHEWPFCGKSYTEKNQLFGT